MKIRKYKATDAKYLAEIYYNTIHNINARDYTKKQLDAWAPKESVTIEFWQEKWQKLPPIIATINEIPIGFAEFDISKKYIDCFYVHHEYQGKGTATKLMAEIFKQAKEHNINFIWSEVSITALPFFEKMGFKILNEQLVSIRGQKLINYKMQLNL